MIIISTFFWFDQINKFSNFRNVTDRFWGIYVFIVSLAILNYMLHILSFLITTSKPAYFSPSPCTFLFHFILFIFTHFYSTPLELPTIRSSTRSVYSQSDKISLRHATGRRSLKRLHCKLPLLQHTHRTSGRFQWFGDSRLDPGFYQGPCVCGMFHHFGSPESREGYTVCC